MPNERKNISQICLFVLSNLEVYMHFFSILFYFLWPAWDGSNVLGFLPHASHRAVFHRAGSSTASVPEPNFEQVLLISKAPVRFLVANRCLTYYQLFSGSELVLAMNRFLPCMDTDVDAAYFSFCANLCRSLRLLINHWQFTENMGCTRLCKSSKVWRYKSCYLEGMINSHHVGV